MSALPPKADIGAAIVKRRLLILSGQSSDDAVTWGCAKYRWFPYSEMKVLRRRITQPINGQV